MSLTEEQIKCLELVKEKKFINYKFCCDDEIAKLLESLVKLRFLKEAVRWIPKGKLWLEYSLTLAGQDILDQATSAKTAQVEDSLKEAG